MLPADFRARVECIETLCRAGPDVYNHNLETVERLTPAVRPQAKYRRSIVVLRIVKRIAPHILTKSGLMVGLGEKYEEIVEVMADLHASGCDILTIGQYLRPSHKHLRVERFYPPEEFEALAREGRRTGLRHVEAGPLVRSSHHAHKQAQPVMAGDG